MAITIGIIYDRDENWIAGSYYIENLVFALKAVTHIEKPHLKIYSREKKQFEQLQRNTKYPYMQWIELVDRNSVLDKVINKITYTLLGKHWIIRGIDAEVDILFPASDSYLFDRIRNKLFWIPDFQEKHFPEFFGAHELSSRKTFQQKLVNRGWPVVFSSQHAYEDFKSLYPKVKNEIFVLPFAVTLPTLDSIHVEVLKGKYNIKREYFICSNQFWAHKNHQIVLEAILELKKKGNEALVVFTGKPHDSRNPGYYMKLMDFVSANGLQDNTLFLGFIDRIEQLVLMKNSIAVIQPSLFEGWSTVVEDAKVLNVPIIVSDIQVHKEQLGDGNFYFSKNNANVLATKMAVFMFQRPPITPYDYKNDVIKFGMNFLDIINKVV